MTIDRMRQLVEDVLAYANSVGEDLPVEAVDLGNEIKAVLGDLSADIETADSKITLGDLPTIAGNPVQLRLLLQNLISNAIKFRDPTQQPVIEIKYLGETGDGLKAMSARDNGIGIDEEHHDRIFGLFKRLRTHSEYHGSGIGLAVCDRIVANHAGRIELSSTKGAGSTFTISLPGDIMKG